jgi:hypothetical protein
MFGTLELYVTDKFVGELENPRWTYYKLYEAPKVLSTKKTLLHIHYYITTTTIDP